MLRVDSSTKIWSRNKSNPQLGTLLNFYSTIFVGCIVHCECFHGNRVKTPPNSKGLPIQCAKCCFESYTFRPNNQQPTRQATNMHLPLCHYSTNRHRDINVWKDQRQIHPEVYNLHRHTTNEWPLICGRGVNDGKQICSGPTPYTAWGGPRCLEEWVFSNYIRRPKNDMQGWQRSTEKKAEFTWNICIAKDIYYLRCGWKPGGSSKSLLIMNSKSLVPFRSHQSTRCCKPLFNTTMLVYQRVVSEHITKWGDILQ